MQTLLASRFRWTLGSAAPICALLAWREWELGYEYVQVQCTQTAIVVFDCSRCRKGFVRNEKTGECVPPALCPCHHGSKSYVEGERINVDCNQWYHFPFGPSSPARNCESLCRSRLELDQRAIQLYYHENIPQLDRIVWYPETTSWLCHLTRFVSDW